METHFAQLLSGGHTEQFGSGALEFRIVELPLFAFEIDDNIILTALRQVGRGLRLGATQQEVFHAAVEALESLGRCVAILTLKVG